MEERLRPFSARLPTITIPEPGSKGQIGKEAAKGVKGQSCALRLALRVRMDGTDERVDFYFAPPPRFHRPSINFSHS
jgi:hypothetical protein